MQIANTVVQPTNQVLQTVDGIFVQMLNIAFDFVFYLNSPQKNRYE